MIIKAMAYRLEAAIDRLLGFPLERRRFYRDLGYRPSLSRPRSYNEKVVWRKLYDRNPLFPAICDKWAMRGFIVSRLGQQRAEQHLVPVLGLFEKPDAITAAHVAAPCVVKPTHRSGDVLLLPAGAERDLDAIRASCRQWLSKPAYRCRHHEWAYGRVRPRIIIEQFLGEEGGGPAADFKFFVFNGRTRMVQMHQDRFGDHQRLVYTRDWQPLELEPTNPDMPAPPGFETMVELAERVARNFDFMRVDMYNINGHIYFGELTCYPASGRRVFQTPEFDFELGRHWQLPAVSVAGRLIPHHNLSRRFRRSLAAAPSG